MKSLTSLISFQFLLTSLNHVDGGGGGGVGGGAGPYYDLSRVGDPACVRACPNRAIIVRLAAATASVCNPLPEWTRAPARSGVPKLSEAI